jgi:hypothetical protein
MAAPLTYGAEWFTPLGMRTFITGFCRFFFNLSVQPSDMLANKRNPVFILLISVEFIKFVDAYSNTGYIFFDFK